ncbi:MAG: S8 family serine peptidase [Solirubrobacteraceae bacterium]
MRSSSPPPTARPYGTSERPVGSLGRLVVATALLLLGGLAPATAVAGKPAADDRAARAGVAKSGPTGRLLVTLREPEGSAVAVRSRLGSVAERAGVRVRERDERRGTVVVDGGDAAERARIARRLQADGRVAEVTAERRARLRSLPNNPGLRVQDPTLPTGEVYQWWAQRLGLPRAWSMTNGKGIRIAVIDSGVDRSHPQLGPVITESYVDGSTTGTKDSDELGHGTHVASLACSVFNGGSGIAGAGGRCGLIVIKSGLTDSSVASSIDLAVDRGADAIVMSFGVDGVADAPTPIREALATAAKEGVVAVAAAADQPVTEQGYPANVLQPHGTGPNLDKGIGLTVTAAQADGTRAPFAGYGGQISVAAYGTYRADRAPFGLLGAFPAGQVGFEQDIHNADGTISPGCRCRTALEGDARYAYLQGTSMATPIVAGVAGLVRDANPDIDAARIVRTIKETASGDGAWNEQTGWGIVDAADAVDKARRIDLREPTARFRTRSRRVSDSRIRLRWRQQDPAPGALVASGIRRVEVFRSIDGRAFRRIGSARRGRLTVRVPRGRVRFALRPIDKAGNRADRPKRKTRRGTILLRR